MPGNRLTRVHMATSNTKWKNMINVITNVAGKQHSAWGKSAVQGLAGTASAVVNEITDLPGLDDMEIKGDFLRNMNKQLGVKSNYFIVTANYEPDPLLRKFFDNVFVDQVIFERMENDAVVPVRSVFLPCLLCRMWCLIRTEGYSGLIRGSIILHTPDQSIRAGQLDHAAGILVTDRLDIGVAYDIEVPANDYLSGSIRPTVLAGETYYSNSPSGAAMERLVHLLRTGRAWSCDWQKNCDCPGN